MYQGKYEGADYDSAVTWVKNESGKKADKSTTYTKTEIDGKIGSKVLTFGGIISNVNDSDIVGGSSYDGNVTDSMIYYVANKGIFMCKGTNSKYYKSWIGSSEYNEGISTIKTDRGFVNKSTGEWFNPEKYYTKTEIDDKIECKVIKCEGDESLCEIIKPYLTFPKYYHNISLLMTTEEEGEMFCDLHFTFIDAAYNDSVDKVRMENFFVDMVGDGRYYFSVWNATDEDKEYYYNELPNCAVREFPLFLDYIRNNCPSITIVPVDDIKEIAKKQNKNIPVNREIFTLEYMHSNTHTFQEGDIVEILPTEEDKGNSLMVTINGIEKKATEYEKDKFHIIHEITEETGLETQFTNTGGVDAKVVLISVSLENELSSKAYKEATYTKTEVDTKLNKQECVHARLVWCDKIRDAGDETSNNGILFSIMVDEGLLPTDTLQLYRIKRRKVGYQVDDEDDKIRTVYRKHGWYPVMDNGIGKPIQLLRTSFISANNTMYPIVVKWGYREGSDYDKKRTDTLLAYEKYAYNWRDPNTEKANLQEGRRMLLLNGHCGIAVHRNGKRISEILHFRIMHDGNTYYYGTW